MRCAALSGLPSYSSRSQGLRPGLSCVAPLGLGAVAHVLQMNIFHVQWCIRGCMRNSYENSALRRICRGGTCARPCGKTDAKILTVTVQGRPGDAPTIEPLVGPDPWDRTLPACTR